MQRYFKILYFLGILAEMFIRIPYDKQRRQIAKTDQRVTPAERGLLSGLLVGMFVLPLVYGLTRWLDFADYRATPAGKARMGLMGGGLMAVAVTLFWRAHHDLGRYWSPSLEIGEQHTLVTQGVYGKIRHPMYTSQLLWSLAQALLLPNWIAGWAGLVSFLPLVWVRVPAEEQMMRDHFGEAYEEYCQQTGALLPRIR